MGYDAELATQAVLENKAWYTEQLKNLFVEMDAEKRGEITFVDFMSHVGDEKVQAYLELLELDTTDVWTLFKLMDNHNDEVVDADDFVASCLKLKRGTVDVEECGSDNIVGVTTASAVLSHDAD